jgi:hypothetical protein
LIYCSAEFEQTPGGCVQWVCDCLQRQHFSVCIFHLQINHRSNEQSPPSHQQLDASFAIKSASFIHNRHSRCIKAALGLNPGSNESGKNEKFSFEKRLRPKENPPEWRRSKKMKKKKRSVPFISRTWLLFPQRRAEIKMSTHK